jgi:hypothetical protein
MSEKRERKGQRGRSIESELLDALDAMKRLDISKVDDASISRMKYIQTMVTTLSDLLAAKRRDKVKEIREDLDAASAEIERLKAQVGVIPPEITEKITSLESENGDLRNRLLTPVVREVVKPDPMTIVERDALAVAVAELSSGLDDDAKMTIVIRLYEKNPAASEALAKVLKVVQFADVKALMAKSNEELRGFANAYKSYLSAPAQMILAHRIQMDSRKAQ